jgi:hypothetical protein
MEGVDGFHGWVDCMGWYGLVELYFYGMDGLM